MMLDLRFNILNNNVHKFIVSRILFSHSGEKKNYNFNIDDYPKFKDKIIYLKITEEPNGLYKDKNDFKNSSYKRLNSIKRIEQSYDHMMKGIIDAEDDDLIIISDNDEIPNLDSKKFKESNKILLYLSNCYFIINLIYFMN